MFKINIVNAKRNPGEVYTFLYDDIPNLEFDFAKNLHIDANYNYTEKEILVNAHITTALKLQCTRCLEDVVYNIDCNVSEVCTKNINTDGGYTYNGDILDIEKLVSDTLYLEIPPQVLCKVDCLGLCSNCGQNLNIKKCECKNQEFNNAFSILREV